MADREVGAAKAETQKTIASLEQKVATEQEKQAALLTQVKQTADTTSTKVDSVQSDVSSVKTDLGSTKSELENTIANLKRVAGDVDNHGSLIATNGKELAALRALGERNYFEFTVAKAKTPQRVGDVSILLKKTDPKKNKYTIEVTADDKKTEKKDKGINEPVQFYTSKAKQPYEIVVNEVRKDTIVGYLSTPKVQNGR
jgi:septal ring factor EnvC (AmiA/AmiB activator)